MHPGGAARLFCWTVRFQTGYPRDGYAVQRVQGEKTIFLSGGGVDRGLSSSVSLFEAFEMAAGIALRTDTVRLTFPPDRRTRLTLELVAGFSADISGADPRPLQPSLADGACHALERPPDGFTPDVVRDIRIDCDLTVEPPEISWSAEIRPPQAKA